MFRIACFAACVAISVFAVPGKEPLNVLFITVDDMNADSIGVFGCAVEGTSPHVDRLAAEGMRFEHAHVQVANCRPSRNVMQSGLYPHNNGVEGFYEVRDHEYPILPDLF
ncbi:MAG: sulfatase-like hydrolase/transferase, partial [Verrucomicrobiota bacterium]